MRQLPVLLLEDFYAIVSGGIINDVNAVLIGRHVFRLKSLFGGFWVYPTHF